MTWSTICSRRKIIVLWVNFSSQRFDWVWIMFKIVDIVYILSLTVFLKSEGRDRHSVKWVVIHILFCTLRYDLSVKNMFFWFLPIENISRKGIHMSILGQSLVWAATLCCVLQNAWTGCSQCFNICALLLEFDASKYMPFWWVIAWKWCCFELNLVS